MIAESTWEHALLASSLLTVAACGGGGSSGSSGGGINTPPSADAGTDQSVDEQTTIVLDGSGSRDVDGDSLTYSWTQTAGTSVVLSDANSAQASFSAPNVGIGSDISLTFELRVSDGSVSDRDAIVVTVNGVSKSDPVVSAGSDRTVGETSSVSLNGTASDSDLGDTLIYAWTQTSGTSQSSTSTPSTAQRRWPLLLGQFPGKLSRKARVPIASPGRRQRSLPEALIPRALLFPGAPLFPEAQQPLLARWTALWRERRKGRSR